MVLTKVDLFEVTGVERTYKLCCSLMSQVKEEKQHTVIEKLLSKVLLISFILLISLQC